MRAGRRGWGRECAQAGLSASPTGWGEGRGARARAPAALRAQVSHPAPGCPLAPAGRLCCREGANQDSSKEPRPLLTSGGSYPHPQSGNGILSFFSGTRQIRHSHRVCRPRPAREQQRPPRTGEAAASQEGGRGAGATPGGSARHVCTLWAPGPRGSPAPPPTFGPRWSPRFPPPRPGPKAGPARAHSAPWREGPTPPLNPASLRDGPGPSRAPQPFPTTPQRGFCGPLCTGKLTEAQKSQAT